MLYAKAMAAACSEDVGLCSKPLPVCSGSRVGGFYVKDSEHEFPEQKLDLYKLESKPVVLFQAASMCLSPEVAL